MKKNLKPELLPLFYQKIEGTDFLHLISNPEKAIGGFESINDALCPYVHVREYLLNIFNGSNSKSFCPFTSFIEKKNGYYAKIFKDKFDADLLLSAIENLRKDFKFLSPEEKEANQKVDPTILVAGFTDEAGNLPFGYKLISVLFEQNRPLIMESGLMMAFTHILHPLGGRPSFTKSKDPLFVSKIPLLILRRMHKEDYVFMKTEDEKNIYLRYFGEVRQGGCPYKH